VAKFKSIRAAKDYLAGQIVDEAARQNVPLTEIERKMLCFSETGSTPPDMMAVSEEFDRDYDQDEYESKIAWLVREIEARDETRSEEEKEDWYEAVLKLCDGDHYLLTLIDGGNSENKAIPSFSGTMERWMPTWDERARREPGDRKRLVLFALGLTIVILTVALIAVRFQ
jgi:hypothetical protein